MALLWLILIVFIFCLIEPVPAPSVPAGPAESAVGEHPGQFPGPDEEDGRSVCSCGLPSAGSADVSSTPMTSQEGS